MIALGCGGVGSGVDGDGMESAREAESPDNRWGRGIMPSGHCGNQSPAAHLLA